MDKVAKPVPSEFLEGSNAAGATLPMSKQGFKNPGPTQRLRGVEANTGKRDGVWSKVPSPEGVTDLTYSVDDAPEYRTRNDG
jgi:hypothetical protein